MREGGNRAAAAEVRKARRPTLAAWAVNQLALDGRLGPLLEVGAGLRRAQQRALSGIRTSELRAAADRRRDLVDGLTAEAADRLRAAGHAPDPHLDAVRGTLLAASADPEAAERVATGRLAKELPASSGFGDLSGLQLVTEPPATEDAEADQDAEDAEARAALEAALAELEDAERSLTEAEAEALRRSHDLDQALAEIERLKRDLDAARHHAAALRRDAERAGDSATRARRAVERLRDRVDAARAGVSRRDPSGSRRSTPLR